MYGEFRIRAITQPDALDVPDAPDAKPSTARPCKHYKGVECVNYVGYICQTFPYPPLLPLWPRTLQDNCPRNFGVFHKGPGWMIGLIVEGHRECSRMAASGESLGRAWAGHGVCWRGAWGLGYSFTILHRKRVFQHRREIQANMPPDSFANTLSRRY